MKRIEIEGQGMFRVPKPVYDMILELNTRAEAAEAEAAQWREMHADRDYDLKHEYARAEAAEAEVQRLREAQAEIANGTECDLCHARRQLNAAMEKVEAIPDFDVAMFDEPILTAYYALDAACSALLHDCDYEAELECPAQ
jgi:hypothetical protein